MDFNCFAKRNMFTGFALITKQLLLFVVIGFGYCNYWNLTFCQAKEKICIHLVWNEFMFFTFRFHFKKNDTYAVWTICAHSQALSANITFAEIASYFAGFFNILRVDFLFYFYFPFFIV